VISTEGLIGFKLQGLVNDPRRTQDLEDIRALLRANHETLNMEEVREYGIVATVTSEREPYEALDDLMSVIEALCPRWPPREISSGLGKFLL
jgi:hypothetical protein